MMKLPFSALAKIRAVAHVSDRCRALGEEGRSQHPVQPGG